MCLPRMTTRLWTTVVAGSAAIFACFGVSAAVAMVVAAFFVSVLMARPDGWRGWLIVLIGAIAALPLFGITLLYTFALRAALFLGHWPSYNNPDPKTLPDRFHPQSEFLEIVLPLVISVSVTNLVAFLVTRVRSNDRFLYAVGMALASWVISYILIVLDPVGVLNWYLD
jgi:MFS family permease